MCETFKNTYFEEHLRANDCFVFDDSFEHIFVYGISKIYKNEYF